MKYSRPGVIPRLLNRMEYLQMRWPSWNHRVRSLGRECCHLKLSRKFLIWAKNSFMEKLAFWNKTGRLMSKSAFKNASNFRALTWEEYLNCLVRNPRNSFSITSEEFRDWGYSASSSRFSSGVKWRGMHRFTDIRALLCVSWKSLLENLRILSFRDASVRPLLSPEFLVEKWGALMWILMKMDH